MISTWGEWKRYPKAARGEKLEASIGPGLYEVRYASTVAQFAFGPVDNLAHALSQLSVGSRSLSSFFIRRTPAELPELEYRTCATATRADARIAEERMIGRREAYMKGAA